MSRVLELDLDLADLELGLKDGADLILCLLWDMVVTPGLNELCSLSLLSSEL